MSKPEVDQDRDPAVALQYRCEFCGATPGAPCAGGPLNLPLDRPHYLRGTVRPAPPATISPGPIRIPVTLLIEMSAEQAAAYATEYGLPNHGGPLRAKDIVDDVNRYVLNAVQEAPAFSETEYGGTRGADVSIKGR